GKSVIMRLTNPEKLEISLALNTPEKAMSAVVSGAEIYLPLAGLIDIEQELARLKKELKKLDAEVERVEKKLANYGFVAKAPEQVIAAEKAKQEDYMAQREQVRARIKELRG